MSALGAAAATLLFSVGASASAPAAGTAPSSAKVFRPVGFHQTTGAASAAPAASSRNLQYMGGSVLAVPKAFIIFWGPDWNTGWTTGGFTSAQAQTYITSFFGGVGGGSWINSTTQYCSGVAAGSQTCGSTGRITNPTAQFGGSWVDTTTVPTRPTDPHNKSISGFGTQFCAYHDNTSFNGQPLAYANMPYAPDAGTSCGRNFVNASNSSFGNGFFDGLSIVAGHEYAEAVTDAFPSNRIAWLDTSGEENGDKCAWNTGPGPQSASTNVTEGSHSFAVQSLWSNAANSATGGCVINRIS
ncbi:MAG: hypothetical protein E6J41_25195 [Chloroflexi bacterium]|nr:MAG: hypothetical protein E6J41_25195 [Chloroflexota bacterium]